MASRACRICGRRIQQGSAVAGACTKCHIEQEKQRPTQIHRFVETSGEGDCSLLVRLYELEERLRRKSLDHFIGLNLVDPPERRDDGVTPPGCITFAETGGEGVHFSLVARKGLVSDTSAVVMTVPDAEEPNLLVGDSLREFLCLGCVAGYMSLEELAFDPDGLMDRLSEKTEDERTLRIYRKELGLRPWPKARERLQELERRKPFVLRPRG
jgi:hypothetical protein